MSDLIKTLPSDNAERKRIKGIIKEIVEAKIQENLFKQQVKDIKDVEKERGYCPKWLGTLAELEYDRIYDSEKKRAGLEEKLEQASDLDILNGIN